MSPKKQLIHTEFEFGAFAGCLATPGKNTLLLVVAQGYDDTDAFFHVMGALEKRLAHHRRNVPISNAMMLMFQDMATETKTSRGRVSLAVAWVNRGKPSEHGTIDLAMAGDLPVMLASGTERFDLYPQGRYLNDGKPVLNHWPFEVDDALCMGTSGLITSAETRRDDLYRIEELVRRGANAESIYREGRHRNPENMLNAAAITCRLLEEEL